MSTTVLHGGELAAEIAEKVVAKAKGKGRVVEAVGMADFKKVKLGEGEMTVIFVIQVSTTPLPFLTPSFFECLIISFSSLPGPHIASTGSSRLSIPFLLIAGMVQSDRPLKRVGSLHTTCYSRDTAGFCFASSLKLCPCTPPTALASSRLVPRLSTQTVTFMRAILWCPKRQSKTTSPPNRPALA